MGKIQLTDITRGINHLKILSLVIVLWYALIFNIERFDLNGESIINLSNEVYFVVILIGIIYLLFPNIQRINLFYTLAIFLVIGPIIRLRFGWQSVDLKIFLSEIVIVAVTLFLLRTLAAYLQDVEEGIDNIILDDNTSHILSFQEAEQQIVEEMRELTKLKRPMTLVYCKLASDDSNFVELVTSEEIINWNMNLMYKFRTRQVQLGRRIMALTYVGDIIFEYRNGIVVCLLESSEEDAQNFVYRVHQFVKRFRDLTLWVGMASFPKDGITFDELINDVTNNLRFYEQEADDTLDQSSITGDVKVNVRERIQIELKAGWVNQLAYQSHTARALYRPVKRLMDIIAAGLGLLLVSPIFLIVGAFVVLNDGFPIFYRQSRVGLGGHNFDMFKFRSMYRNAPPLEPVIVELPDGSIREDWPEKVENDPRITPIGKHIRKWSIDELPQLWNVLKGDMSLIGPRPSSWPLEKHTLQQTARLSVKPGITGLWQVSARESKNFDERLLWDLKYAEKMSLLLDILIILRTFRAVIRKTGV